MTQIINLILKRGEPVTSTEEYFARTPFLEVVGEQGVKKMKRPGCIKIHLPFDRINFSNEAKYIYVARHPADCVVSFYHHTRYFPIYSFSDGTFDEFFDLFVKGAVDFGDYFDHLLSWYEHRNEENIFFITFEAMKADHRTSILKVAKFLGQEYYDFLVANKEEILEKVIQYSSLEYMKGTTEKFWKEIFSVSPPEEVQEESPVLKKYAQLAAEAKTSGHCSIGDFVRKGTVGEGKITLSKEQLDKLNARIEEKTSHSDVMNLWKGNEVKQ
ncbi:Sulfotransferase family cytosolic 2B member 1, partial [Stegodyphus mimosarum]